MTSSLFFKMSQVCTCSFMGIALITTGCSSTGTIAQSSKGNVYLEDISNWRYEASHPAVIDQTTILKIVKGLHGNQPQNESPEMSAGGSKPMRLFSDEDAEFLTPLLAQGLSKAKPDQVVGFSVSSSAGSGLEPTAGSIYVKNGSIYVTITKGVTDTTFLPQEAARTEQTPIFLAAGVVGSKSHVIDYHELAMEPVPASMATTQSAETPSAAEAPVAAIADSSPTAPMPMAADAIASLNGTPEEQLTQAKEAIAKKENEIDMLRKEADWMKRKLRARDEEVKALKASVKKTLKHRRASVKPTQ